MGGCIDREVRCTQVPVYNKPKNSGQGSAFPTSQDALIFRPKSNQATSDNILGSDFALATTSRRKKDWDTLRKLVTSTEAVIGKANINTLWATAPTKVGALSLAYMSQGAYEQPSVLSTFVLEMVPFLLMAMNSGQKELSDHALLFLYFTIDHISKVTREEILGLKGFNVLISVMNDSRSDPRQFAATICHSLYKNNVKAQSKFLESGGGQHLIHLLMRECDDENNVVQLLTFLQDLISITADGETKVIREHAEVLSNSSIHDTLSCLNFENFSPETNEEVDKLMRLLAK